MQIIQGSAAFPPALHGAVLTMGNFDGVHIGHQTICRDVVAKARGWGCASVAYTFDPHPLRVLAPALQLTMLQTVPQRLQALAAAGLDATVVEPFTPEIAALPPQAFLTEILWQRLRPRAVVIGYDFTFGQRRAGRVADLERFGAEHKLQVDVIEPVFCGPILVSSTYLRHCIEQGDVEAAATALGRPYTIGGTLVTGRGVGRQLGFPTLNVRSSNELLPATGVYVTWALHAATQLPAVTYVGHNPTFGGTGLVVETHLLTACPPDITQLEVSFLRRLRGDIHFECVDDLTRQIAQDVAAARAYHQL
ncbi:MAG: bifunctional riboflavin kinase/FAD synthetase [Deltaproteobacteria bacterium]|nr:bifunctional riboflavin kinase/FAD synthetase [Deltaproteobacteria bacterium]